MSFLILKNCSTVDILITTSSFVRISSLYSTTGFLNAVPLIFNVYVVFFVKLEILMLCVSTSNSKFLV